MKIDVHLHTCLSPCADIWQTPIRIVRKSVKAGLEMIFITDHNSTKNVEAAIRAAEPAGKIKVYPGMEITTREEIHILSLFENITEAKKVQERINKYLPDVFNDKEREEQIIVNEFDEVEGYCSKSLMSAVDLSLNEIINIVHFHKGLVIAAHIDRPSFSVISQLGFIPEDAGFDGLEISPNISYEEAEKKYGDYSGKYKYIRGSDSHTQETLGSIYTEYVPNKNNIGFDSLRRYLNV